MKILVTYASKRNQITEISHFIAVVIRRSLECRVDVRRIGAMPDLDEYDAVIVGSPTLLGQWQTDALQFLCWYKTTLAQKYVWIFSCGPPGQGDHDLTSGWYPKGAQGMLDEIKPRHTALFHSKPSEKVLGVFDVKDIEGQQSWNTIKAWAESIAYYLNWATQNDPDKAIPAL